MLKYFLLFVVSIVTFGLQAQNELDQMGTKIKINYAGQVYSAIVTPTGDTLILFDLDNIQITASRGFTSDEDKRKYDRFKNYAALVYPYAKEAIRIFRELEYASNYMSKKERKNKIADLEGQLTKQFEEPLSNLTKLQGKIMIKMIEKETGQPIYNHIKELKGGFKAFYWNAFSKLYSYDLKEGYTPGQYVVLDAVLQDFDVSYRIENGTSLKYINIKDLKNFRK